MGSRLLGAHRTKELWILRDVLCALGLCTGVLSSLTLYLGQSHILAWFLPPTDDAETLRARIEALHSVWPLLCACQTVNALVFVYDGVLYATQSFAYLRNLTLCACGLVYVPILFLELEVWGMSLLALWSAKACLNATRCVGAIWLLHFSLPGASDDQTGETLPLLGGEKIS